MDSLKTVWQDANTKDIWSFYCPQCKIPRRVPYRPRPSAKHYAQIALTAIVFMLLTWNWFTWKGIVAFVPIWTAFEMIYRTRMRAALNCESCGFDPILYLVDVNRARREIEQHWRKKFEEKGLAYPDPKGAKSGRTSATPPPVRKPQVSGIEEELANTRGSNTTQ